MEIRQRQVVPVVEEVVAEQETLLKRMVVIQTMEKTELLATMIMIEMMMKIIAIKGKEVNSETGLV